MNIEFHPDTAKVLKRLPNKVLLVVLKAIIGLGNDPRPNNCKKLVGAGHNDYRIRIGEYRIVYEVDDAVETVTVMRVDSRGNVYKP